MDGRYFDWLGEPITQTEWAQLFGDERHIGDDCVGDVHVSTVWLGLNHQFADGPPLIFESMIFGGEHDQWQWRYSTLEQARDGHACILAALRAGEAPDDAMGARARRGVGPAN